MNEISYKNTGTPAKLRRKRDNAKKHNCSKMNFSVIFLVIIAIRAEPLRYKHQRRKINLCKSTRNEDNKSIKNFTS